MSNAARIPTAQPYCNGNITPGETVRVSERVEGLTAGSPLVAYGRFRRKADFGRSSAPAHL